MNERLSQFARDFTYTVRNVTITNVNRTWIAPNPNRVFLRIMSTQATGQLTIQIDDSQALSMEIVPAGIGNSMEYNMSNHFILCSLGYRMVSTVVAQTVTIVEIVYRGVS